MVFALPGYPVVDVIYESAKTVVYRAVREQDGVTVAIKTLRGEHPNRQEVARFCHEYHIRRKLLGASGVADAYALENFANKPALVQEYVAGGNLLTLPNDSPDNGLERFFTLATQVAAAVGEIHRRYVIHKDINPHNILWNAETRTIKIVDFDIASELSREKQSQSAVLLRGSLPYISPEQTGRMNRAIDYRSDFYSLGVTLYQLLSGELPFEVDDNDPSSWIHCHIAKEPKPLHCPEPAIAPALAAIIGKLLAKNAEDRYQSALGIQNDLVLCWRHWREAGSVTDFIAGLQDFSDRFEIPQKLYGRKAEVARLMQAFAAIGEGSAKMFLVSGYSGIGKSALINEVHKPIAARNGYFIEGKFDQFQQNIPYFAIAQSFGRLIRQLLVEPAEILHHRRTELLEALGTNGQVLIDIIPELEQIIGPQPPVPHLGTEENQNRFNRLFQQFLHVFTRRNQPLVLFIDDLQWVDSASLNLIKQFMLNRQQRYFLFIGAYRDNEVDDHHPFIAAGRDLKKAGVEISNLILKPLALEHINRLIAETLCCATEVTLPLAKLVLQKTGGNPFFINQFLRNCYETGLLTFDTTGRQWRWDLQDIARQNSSDNVVDLMLAKMARLPEPTRELLRLGACIGNAFYLQTLAIIAEQSPIQTARELWPAIDAGLLLADNEGHALLKCLEEIGIEQIETFPAVGNRFLHDRVQQAAYSLIDADQKQQVHLKIARLLLRETPQEELDNRYFDIVEHYNKSIALLDSTKERRLLAELNLKAGLKAKEATAYGPALQYFLQGSQCCPAENEPEHEYRLRFGLEKGQIECHFLLSEPAEGIAKADVLLQKCHSVEDKIALNNILILYYGGAGEMDRAIDIALASLRYFGVDLPRNPNKLQLLAELLQAKLRLGRKSSAQLLAMPEFEDHDLYSVFSLLKELIAPTYLQGLTNLLPYIILRMFNLTLQYGNSPVASFAYSGYALLWAKLDGFAEAYRFGIVALEYNKYVNNPPMEARCYFMTTSFALYWGQAFRDCRPLRKTGLQKLIDTGEYFWASYIYLFGFWQEVLLSESLDELFELTEREIRFANKAKQVEPFHVHTLHRNLFKNLAGETLDSAPLDLEVGEEAAALAYFERNVTSTMGKFYHVVCRLLLHFYREEYNTALRYVTHADMTEEVIRDGTFTRVIYTFFTCLCILAAGDRSARLQAIYRQRKRRLREWQQLCPHNFAAFWSLLLAEEAALGGKDLAAMRHYERAIEAARENASLFLESLANELYAKFWLKRDKQKIAAAYMDEAAYLYYRWGARGKQEQLQKTYKAAFSQTPSIKPHLTEKTATIDLTTEESSLDLNTLSKASQLLTGEISMDKLLRKLMHFLIESAGAQKGILILQEDERLVVAASCRVEEGQEIIAQQKISLENSTILSPAIVRLVARSQKMLALGNAADDPDFAQDAYIREHGVKSVLCFPLMQDRDKLKGILYLENNLASDTFTPGRVEVLNVLSGEIAVALENARLYRNLEEYNQTLEEKVAERTKDLHAMNDALLTKNAEIRESKEIIEEKNANITKSLIYAQKIQLALLPQDEKIAAALPYFFIIFKPKQIVSGDFYWFNQIGSKIFIAVADCTGHGVPGAFLSMIGHMLLNKIVNENRVFEPARVLEALHEEVRNVLRQEEQTRQGYDGMDIAFCCIDAERHRILFAGAKRPLYLVSPRDGQNALMKIRGDRKSIGGRQKEQQRRFTGHTVDYYPGDALYLCSDGLADQHNTDNEKLGSAALERLLQLSAAEPMAKRKSLIEEQLLKHQGDRLQRDDMTLLGVKL
ncbi:MAG: AAA family ATPase [Gammaproteobacteria bacterium]